MALAILSLLLLGVSMALRTGVLAWEKGEASAEANQRMRSVMSLLAEEIASLDPVEVQSEGERTLAFLAESNSLSFVTDSPRIFSGFEGPVLIKYEVSLQKGGAVLTRLEAPISSVDRVLEWQRLAHGGSILWEGLHEIRFLYHRKAEPGHRKEEWQERWDPKIEKGLPDAAMIRIRGTNASNSPEVVQPILIHAKPVEKAESPGD